MNGLDLFSGIGGITIALEEWVKPVAYCENDRYAQAVLLSRQSSGELPQAPIWDDIKTLNKEVLQCESLDIIYGGFPCQDISVAGNGKGLAGERSGLVFEFFRLISSYRPTFVFMENVPAITIRGLDRILLEFATLGYDARWTIVSAAEIGALHIRERWFLLAHAHGKSVRKKQITWEGCKNPSEFRKNGITGEIAWASDWIAQPRVDRTGDGIQARRERTQALGNAVVPGQTKEAFRKLIGFSN